MLVELGDFVFVSLPAVWASVVEGMGLAVLCIVSRFVRQLLSSG